MDHPGSRARLDLFSHIYCTVSPAVRGSIEAVRFSMHSMQSHTASNNCHPYEVLYVRSLQAKKRVLADTIAKINSKHGAGTVMQMTGGALDV